MLINLNKDDHNSLKNLIQIASNNKINELECIIGNTSSMNMNSKNDLVNILRRIKGKEPFKSVKIYNTLSISVDDKDINKHISRVVVNNVGAIGTYCHNDSIKDVLNNVVFERKSKLNNGLIINNYNLKFNVKEELEIDRYDPIVKKLIDNWETYKKSYRRKMTYSFYHSDNDFKIDLSIISEPKDERYSVDYVIKKNLMYKVIGENRKGQSFSEWWDEISKNKNATVKLFNHSKYYRNLKESKVMETNKYRYEFEIEWIGNKDASKIKRPSGATTSKEVQEYFERVTTKFMSIITILEQAIQTSFFILGKQEKLSVVNEFLKLAKIRQTHDFFPLAIDLNINNMKELDLGDYKNEINIRSDYFVTEKADGERTLLFISKNGKCYLIDRQNKIIYTGLVMPDYSNSVFDGEFITKTLSGTFVQNIYLFDAYIVKGEDLTKNVFGLENETNGRHIHIGKLVDNFTNSPNNLVEHNLYSLSIFKKKYYRSDLSKKMKKDNMIFNSCKDILAKVDMKYGGLLENSHMFSYPIDGLIFQPIYLGVGQNNKDDVVKNIGRRWNANFKWKPMHHNTIDLKISFIKEMGKNTPKINYYGNSRYIAGTLFMKVYNNIESRKNLAFKLLNDGDNFDLYDEDMPFTPLNPYNGKLVSDNKLQDYVSEINIKLDKNGVARCENGDIIEDDITIECRYDIDNIEPKFRWIPIRTRTDKSPNAINTAFTTWRLINNPITTKMIIGEDSIKSDVESFYYRPSGDYISDPMKKFNNFVKRQLIDTGLDNKLRPRVLDLACGKMGDLAKYVSNRVEVLIGLDISSDNLFNKDDGAAVRLLGLSNRSIPPEQKKMTDKTILMLGNATRNLANGDACADDLSRYYCNILYGRHKPERGKLQRMYNMAINQFHLVVCNFAIHYMMNNEDDLHQFLLNVQQNLIDQGYFVITFLDGKEIIKKLEKGSKNNSKKGKNEIYSVKANRVQKGGYIQGTVDDHIVWSISADEKLSLSKSPYGQKVKSYLETFYQPTEENLVDIDFLSKHAENYDLKLIDTNLFMEIPNSMYNKFKDENPKIWKEIDNNDILKEWLSFHRWAIFQKSTNIDASIIDEN